MLNRRKLTLSEALNTVVNALALHVGQIKGRPTLL